MNIHDTDVEAKQGAQSLIEAMDGFSISLAFDALEKLELQIKSSFLYIPPQIEKLAGRVNHLNKSTALKACHLAKHMIHSRTLIDAGSVGMQQMFTVWQFEADITNTWKSAQ